MLPWYTRARMVKQTFSDRNPCDVAIQPIRIALDASCLGTSPLTGVGYYTLNLLQALLAKDRALDIRLFAASAQPMPSQLGEWARGCSSVRTLRWPTRLRRWMWTQLQWPPIEWFTGSVDIAHGAFHLLPPARGAKRIVTVFDLTSIRRPETHTATSVRMDVDTLRHAVRHADALIAISESCRQDLVGLLDVPHEKTRVVYGGVDLDEFRGPLDESALSDLKIRLGIRDRYLIHLGTLEPRKNLPRLIEAFARVKARRSDCPQLVLAGRLGWMYDDVFRAISRLGMDKTIIHTGYVARRDAVLLLRGACGCAYPSLYEGFGLPVLEAMAARVPVLTSNVSSLPEVIGDTGILVDPENTDSIEAGLDALLEDTGAGPNRAEAAFERACRFTWERSADVLANLYHTLQERQE